jgi:hypothetical protein
VMALGANDNERYHKQKRKRLQRFTLAMAQDRTGRACGGCTAWCFVMGVAEVPTPFYTRCPHICAAGCEVYGKHPGTCRDFYCEWLVGWLGEVDRPDLLGLLFVANRLREADGADTEFLTAYEVSPGAADTDRARTVLGSLGPDVGLFRFGDVSHCTHLGTGQRIEPEIAASVLPRPADDSAG